MNLQRRIYHLNEINHIDVLIDPKEEKKMKRSSRYRILMTILIIIVNIIKLSNIRCLSRSTLFIIFMQHAEADYTYSLPINIYLCLCCSCSLFALLSILLLDCAMVQSKYISILRVLCCTVYFVVSALFKQL